MVETGKYSKPKIKRESRICMLCNTKEVEDERHLIFNCNTHSAHAEKPFSIKYTAVLSKLKVLLIVYNHIKNTWHNTKRDCCDWLVLYCYYCNNILL